MYLTHANKSALPRCPKGERLRKIRERGRINSPGIGAKERVRRHGSSLALRLQPSNGGKLRSGQGGGRKADVGAAAEARTGLRAGLAAAGSLPVRRLLSGVGFATGSRSDSAFP